MFVSVCEQFSDVQLETMTGYMHITYLYIERNAIIFTWYCAIDPIVYTVPLI